MKVLKALEHHEETLIRVVYTQFELYDCTVFCPFPSWTWTAWASWNQPASQPAKPPGHHRPLSRHAVPWLVPWPG